MNRCFNFGITLFVCSILTSLAGPYDALPLRSSVAPEPHFQTAEGRNSHRYSSGAINSYRLYDFYSRQAEYHLVPGRPFKTLLLPYPGLEGGRRGHWGGTNEKLSSAYLKRNKEPRYHRLLCRHQHANQYVCISHTYSQSVCTFPRQSPWMGKVTLKASLKAPVHVFAYQVDRFGFGMQVTGQDYLLNQGAEWHHPSGKPASITTQGYHLHGDQVIFSRSLGNVPYLDRAYITYKDDQAIYNRTIEWLDQSPALKFKLPQPAKPLLSPQVLVDQSTNSCKIIITGKQRRLIHQAHSTQGMQGIKLEHYKNHLWVTFPKSSKNSRIMMTSRVIPLAAQNIPGTLPIPKLSDLLQGGPRYFKQNIQVKGILNADPAASNTGYEVDDIPVPVENPYGVPMTTCGLAFADNGTAYISTLVGDIWKVTGLDASLTNVTWQRFASGINLPLGLEMVDGVLHAICANGLLQFYDYNQDGEADCIRTFNTIPIRGQHPQDLQRDAQGNFYFSLKSGIHKLSANGKKLERISGHSRNPLGIGVRSDGLALSDSSEGNNSNGTCTIYESEHPENKNTISKHRRILYIPRGIDNSPGSRLFLNTKVFGPLGKGILGVSYGSGRIYQILRDPNNGTPQAALHPLPGEFSSGSARLTINPKDQQLYIVGFDAFGDFAVEEGCLHRLRYTGKPCLLPQSWKAHTNGISIRFNTPLAQDSINLSKLFVQQWNYRDSRHTYGSPEYSVKQPDKLGHDRLTIQSAYLSPDGYELFLHIPNIRPAMCTQVYGHIRSTSGAKLKLNLFATINRLRPDHFKGNKTPAQKPRDLKVPYHDKNGNSYQTLMQFFDKRSGKTTAKRPVGPKITYTAKEINYAWIHKNIIKKQNCIACHGPNSKHDFSNYELLIKTINTKQPSKSHLLGMISTGSMPPYPMPTVAPEMQKALELWIKKGAPK